MQNQLPHIRSAIYSTPWAITAPWLEDICAIFERHAAGQAPKAFVAKERKRHCPDCKTGILKEKKIQATSEPNTYMLVRGQMECPNCGCECSEEDMKPYDIVNGVAILPLCGPLFPKANLLTMMSGATSYEEFGNGVQMAMEDSEVSGIYIPSDSPGGSCLGLAECCNRIYTARETGTKPIMALVSPMACSAAYAIVSQCDQVFISESGMAGSIGTILKYNNWDRAERNEGNDAVMMTSSDVKSFGTPQSVAQYQSLMDTLQSYFEQFKEIVVRGRPGIEIEKVSGAKVWIGKQCVSMGICDGMATEPEMLSMMSADMAK